MKKSIFLLIVTISLSSLLSAQILNNSFESWAAGEPTNWSTNNDPSFSPITQSATAYDGASAVKLEVLDPGVGFPLLPVLFSDGAFTINQRYGGLTGYYQFQPNGNNEVLWTTCFLQYGDSLVGAGSIYLPSAASYTEFTVPFLYNSPLTPDSIYINFVILDTTLFFTATIGSWALVDYLNLSTSVGVEPSELIQINFALQQNYPNPFNPSTKIKYSIPQSSNVLIKVYDVLGSEVETLVNEEKPIGTYELNWNAANLPSGVYLYRLQAGDFVQTRKMILLR